MINLLLIFLILFSQLVFAQEEIVAPMTHSTSYSDYENIRANSANIKNIISNTSVVNPTSPSDFNLVNMTAGIRIFEITPIDVNANIADTSAGFNYIDADAQNANISLNNNFVNTGLKIKETNILNYYIKTAGNPSALTKSANFNIDNSNKKFEYLWQIGAFTPESVLNLNYISASNKWKLNMTGTIKSNRNIYSDNNMTVANYAGAGFADMQAFKDDYLNNLSFFDNSTNSKSKLILDSANNNSVGLTFRAGNGVSMQDTANFSAKSDTSNLFYIRMPQNPTNTLTNIDALTILDIGNIGIGTNNYNPDSKLVLDSGDPNTNYTGILFKSEVAGVAPLPNEYRSTFRIKSGWHDTSAGLGNQKLSIDGFPSIVGGVETALKPIMSFKADGTFFIGDDASLNYKLKIPNNGAIKVNNTYLSNSDSTALIGYNSGGSAIQIDNNNINFNTNTITTTAGHWVSISSFPYVRWVPRTISNSLTNTLQIQDDGITKINDSAILSVNKILFDTTPIRLFWFPSSGALLMEGGLKITDPEGRVYNQNDWLCVIAGYFTGKGNIAEIYGANYMYCHTYVQNNEWFVQGEFLSHSGSHEPWRVRVMAISTKIAKFRGDGWPNHIPKI